MAHQGTHGHLTWKQTSAQIADVFDWVGRSKDVEAWVCNCLQCIKLHHGKLIPRPMAHQVIATQPGEVIACDFLDMPPDRHGVWKANFAVVGQITRICVVTPTKDKTAATAARILHER